MSNGEKALLAISIVLGVIALVKVVNSVMRRVTRVCAAIEGDPSTGQLSLAEWQRKIENALIGSIGAGQESASERGILGQVTDIKETVSSHGSQLDRIQKELTLTANGEQSVKNLVARTSRDLEAHLVDADRRMQRMTAHMYEMREALVKQGVDVPEIKTVDEWAEENGFATPAQRGTTQRQL